jgi:two-component system chemotaxis response regulator CheY
MQNVKVLIVDDEGCIRDLVKEKLAREGREVVVASRGKEAIEIFRRIRPDITILDIDMPEMNGIEVLRNIRSIDSNATVMLFTGCETDHYVEEAKRLGVTEILQKGYPFSLVWDNRRRRL